MKKPYIIGICGASASGKTYLLQELLHRLPADQVSLVSQDNYYKDLAEQHRTTEGLVNFDQAFFVLNYSCFKKKSRKKYLRNY